MQMKLEENTASSLKVPNGKPFVQVFDTAMPGFFLRKYKSGSACWGVRYELGGKSRQKIVRDVVPGVNSLKAARKAADVVRAKAKGMGIDVVQQERQARADNKARGETIEKLAKQYIAERSTPAPGKKKIWKPRYRQEVERHLTKDWKAVAKKPIKAVTRELIVAALDKIEAGQGSVAADRASAALSGLFSWALNRCKVDSHPMTRMEKRAGNTARARSLSEEELVDVWRATDLLSNTAYARIVKLLILTACRRDEIGRLPWDEVNDVGKRLELPGGVEGVTKNRLKHLVPLSMLALAQLPARPDPNDPAPRTTLFGRRHHKGFGGWSKAKEQLATEISTIRKKRGAGEMPAWRLHDLRHTFSTLARERRLGDVHLIELAINHSSGTRAGVAGIYDHSDRWYERVKLFDAWAKYVEGLLAAA